MLTSFNDVTTAWGELIFWSSSNKINEGTRPRPPEKLQLPAIALLAKSLNNILAK